MVTGAGGSIGSELARQVARFKPADLLLVERAEFALFDIDQDLRRWFPELDDPSAGRRRRGRSADPVDLRDLLGLHVVLHAAAHKHVPMMESNPARRSRTTCWHAACWRDLADELGVQDFVMISTDKAVNPTSVMGASKRVAERFVQRSPRRHRRSSSSVRFGNVLGSAGSVVPIFQEQIRRGGPVTVTHPDMRTLLHDDSRSVAAGAAGRPRWARAARSSCSTWASRSEF